MPGGTGKPLGMWSRHEVRHQWVYWQGVTYAYRVGQPPSKLVRRGDLGLRNSGSLRGMGNP